MADLTIYAVEALGAADGSGGGVGGGGGSGGVALFDAFTDTDGTALQSHSPTGGSGSWSKHPSYPSGALAVSGGRLQRADLTPAASLYITDSGHAGTDVRATWTQGDDDVTLLADAQCGVGLRVDPSADTGYFAVAYNDETSGTAEWMILKRVAGVETTLASGGTKAWIVAPPVAMDFAVSGTGLVLKINGVTAATATDSSITGPGRYAVLFKPVGVPDGPGSWIDSLSIGSPSGGTIPPVPGPEGVVAMIRGVEAIGSGESAGTAAAISARDAFGWSEFARFSADVAAVEAFIGADGFQLAATLPQSDAWGASEGDPARSTLVHAIDAWGFADRAYGAAVAPVVFDVRPWPFGSPHPFAGPPLVGEPIFVYACESWGGSESAASVSAAIYAKEAVRWAEMASTVVGVWATESWRAESAWTAREVVATVYYSIYGGDDEGGPVDYGTALATTTDTFWSTDPLDVPGVYRFAVRAAAELGGEEKNLDAEILIRLDASGVDVTAIPGPPTALGAISIKGGAIRVTWAAPAGGYAPAGYRVYAAVGGPLSYATPAATTPAGPTRSGTYSATLSGLADGATYLIGVRAYNDAGEERNTIVVSAVSDATGPAPVVDLAISTDPEDW